MLTERRKTFNNDKKRKYCTDTGMACVTTVLPLRGHGNRVDHNYNEKRKRMKEKEKKKGKKVASKPILRKRKVSKKKKKKMKEQKKGGKPHQGENHQRGTKHYCFCAGHSCPIN